MSAAMSAVVTPVQTTTVSEDVTPLIAPNEKSGYTRATRNTPAATIVAAWISAETGVGPSIASGNHACSGNWPDLPQAPSSNSTDIASSSPLENLPSCTAANTSVYWVEPTTLNMMKIAIARPTSPTRFIRNAFFAAVAADGRLVYQPISRYDARP